MKIDVVKMDGSKLDSPMDLEAGIYGIEPNDHCIALAVKAEMANIRQGTHKAKTRAEVSGGGKKPWRQKGRGTARSGSSRSPVWVGGGKAFGPVPRSYKMKLNKKVKKLARKSALAYKVKNDKLVIVDDLNMTSAKTRDFVAVLKNLGVQDKKITLLVNTLEENLYLASRNVPHVFVMETQYASTYDIMDCEVLIIDMASVETLNTMLEL